MTDTTTSQSQTVQRERLAEAARYALLRRLAPAIRHDIAGALQPISMVAVLLEKRLQKPEPDMTVIGKNVHDINTLAREASAACMQLMGWLAPKQDGPVPVHEGVQEALALMATELSFQGIELVNSTSGVAISLPVSVMRGLFMAGLLALTDAQTGPGTVVVSAEIADGRPVLSLSFTATPAGEAGDDDMAVPPAYRALDWDDVQALAAAVSVSLVISSTQLELYFPG